MYNLTSRMELKRDRMAVVLDDVVKSAPTVNSVLSKSFVITGLDGPGEAEALTKVLSNPLTNKLNFESASEISASLGHTALLQGEYAGITGLILCFIMMIIYYRFAGLVAIVGLTINALLLLGAMSIFGFELTLPGIAGIVLTLGVAVDANVLIYERLREEKEAGRPFRVAIRNSFDKAFSAIFDSNITSLITAVILYWMATGTIKGFAVTLTVGVITSMIGAILVTRVLFYWADTIGIMKDVKFLNLFKSKSNINFMGQRGMSCSISAILLVICIVVGAMKGKDCLGMDFTGGSSISYLVNKGDFRQGGGRCRQQAGPDPEGYRAGSGGIHGQQQGEHPGQLFRQCPGQGGNHLRPEEILPGAGQRAVQRGNHRPVHGVRHADYLRMGPVLRYSGHHDLPDGAV